MLETSKLSSTSKLNKTIANKKAGAKNEGEGDGSDQELGSVPDTVLFYFSSNILFDITWSTASKLALWCFTLCKVLQYKFW